MGDGSAMDESIEAHAGGFLPFLPCKHHRSAVLQYPSRHDSAQLFRPHAGIIHSLPRLEPLTSAITKTDRCARKGAPTKQARVLLPDIPQELANILSGAGSGKNWSNW